MEGMEVEKRDSSEVEVTDTDIAAANKYIAGYDARHIAREMGMTEAAVRNAIDRAVQVHEPTQEKLNVARADMLDVIKRINEALDSGAVRPNSQAFSSLLGRRIAARERLDRYNGLDSPPEQPRLYITVADRVQMAAGYQEVPHDIVEQ